MGYRISAFHFESREEINLTGGNCSELLESMKIWALGLNPNKPIVFECDCEYDHNEPVISISELSVFIKTELFSMCKEIVSSVNDETMELLRIKYEHETVIQQACSLYHDLVENNVDKVIITG